MTMSWLPNFLVEKKLACKVVKSLGLSEFLATGYCNGGPIGQFMLGKLKSPHRSMLAVGVGYLDKFVVI